MQKKHDDAQDTAMRARIRQAIESKGLKIKQFARESGMAYPSLRDYHSGLRKPGFDALATIIRFTGVSADWVLLGDGPMFPDEPPPFAPVDERLMAQISQRVAMAFAAPDTPHGPSVEELEKFTADDDPIIQARLNDAGEQSVIASTIYNRVALIDEAGEREATIAKQVAILVHLRRSIQATRLGNR